MSYVRFQDLTRYVPDEQVPRSVIVAIPQESDEFFIVGQFPVAKQYAP
jgi:hypothetical protein